MSLGPAKSRQDLISKRQNKQKHLHSDDSEDFLQKSMLSDTDQLKLKWLG